MPTRRTLALLLAAGLAGPAACIDDIAVPPATPPVESAPGVPQRVTLRALSFEVKNFEQAVTLEQMRKLPRKILDDLWLLDFDLTESVTIVLDELSALPPAEADKLAPPAQNMRKLLNMTADNCDLKGTKLEELISLSAAVGVPPAKALAALMQIGVTDRAIPPEVVSTVFLDLLLGSHPSAKTRKGAVDADHPDGLYPIAPRSLPITLGDIVYAFESLPDRFGPAPLDADDPNSLVHPGFVLAASGITKDAFTMYVRVTLNALPFKGVDLTTNYIASVNSTASQIEHVFNYDDPDWIRVDGLTDDLTISEMTVRVLEDDAFVPGGDSKDPTPTGNSPAWDLPPWLFEHLIAEIARQQTITAIGPHCDEYKLATDVVAFEACVDATGWTELTTFTDVGNPPPPAYFWDILGEVAQVRLHDGGLAEGDADVEFTLRDINIPLDQAKIVAQIKANLEANPEALIGITEQLNDNADGDADFYYFKPEPKTPGAATGDYLFFVTEADLRKDKDGLPVRKYGYEKPGFFADPDLTDKVSSTAEVAGDTSHEKVQIAPGDLLYVADDDGRRYQLAVVEKPSDRNITLEITRL